MFHFDGNLPKNGWKYRVVNGVLHCFGHIVDQASKIDLKPLSAALSEDGLEIERRIAVYSSWPQGWKSEVRRALGIDSVDFVISLKEAVNSPRLNPTQKANIIYYLNVCVPRGIVKVLGELANDKILGNKLKSLRTITCLFKTSVETLGKRAVWFGPNDTMFIGAGFPEHSMLQEVPATANFNPTEGVALDISPDLFYTAFALLGSVTRDKSSDKKKIQKQVKEPPSRRDKMFCHKMTAREHRIDNPIFQSSIYSNYVEKNEFAL